MKLYTEEQVKTMLNRARIFDGHVGNNFIYILSNLEILSAEIPIELPSDEDIIKGHDAKEFQFISFWAGAAWCRNYILKQNNNMAEKIEHIVDPNKMMTAVNWLISKQKHNKFFDIETIEEAREMEKYQIGQFLNWFIKHYSTTNIDGFFGWADSMDKEVTIADILAHYYNENPTL